MLLTQRLLYGNHLSLPVCYRHWLVHNYHSACTVSTGPSWHQSPTVTSSPTRTCSSFNKCSHGICLEFSIKVQLTAASAYTFKMQGPGLAFAPLEPPFCSAMALLLTFRTCYKEYTDINMKDLIFTPHELSNCCYS